MSNTIEHAREGLEHAHHASHGGGEHSDKSAQRVAILIAILAACLALAELSEKAAQNEYLTHHISVSDTYAFLQGKNARRVTYDTAAEVIASLPTVDEAAQKRIDKLHTDAKRMADDPVGGEGAKQLLVRAEEQSKERDHAFHVYHQFELATGALQIAIVLASVSIVTRVRMLTWAGAAIGGIAAIFGILVKLGIA